MRRKQKIAVAAILLACGAALIAWNMRDPDAAYREQPKVETVVTVQQVPPAVQATIQRISAGGTLHEIQEERRGDDIKYEVEIIRGNTKTEYAIAPDGSVTGQKSKQVKH
jgi:hypothetical protein